MSKSSVKKGLAWSMKRMLRDQSGNMAAAVAVVALPLMMAGGAAVDYGNWVSVQARLQAATDAAALAAGREINLSDAELQRVATDYFHSNFGKPKNAGTPQVTMTITDNGKLRIDSKVTVGNYLMKVVGKDNQVIVATSEVNKESTGLEVALVFDNTGSMASQSRLSTLKVAANDFVEILFGPRSEADSLKVAVVPFSQFVNVGPDKADAPWLDTEGRNPLSRVNFIGSGADPQHNWAAWKAITNLQKKHTWAGCVESRGGVMSVNDASPNIVDPNTLFVPALAPDEPGNDSANQECYNSNGDPSSCGSPTYVYYNNYLDDDGNKKGEAPTNVVGGYNRVDWLQRSSKKYRRNRANTNTRGPNEGCDIQPVQALTNKKAPVLNTINAMKADGYTHVAEGVGWGLRVLSPGAPFTEGASYDDKEITKAMVLLTDGENTFDTESNHNGSTYSAYGFLNQARLGSSNYWTAIGKQNALLEDACDNVKEAGIVVYSFAYNVSSSTQRNLIKSCASSPEKYFDPPSNAALVKNFQMVADELRRLHLSQ